MNSKLRALDLFCGAGGASMGLHRAGFEVEGVDVAPQKRYPFKFHQGDALDFDLTGFDFVWASPVCKHFSQATRTAGTNHLWPAEQIAQVRARLVEWGGPYVIENVPGAPLRNAFTLCGAMFGLQTYRHRIFESNVLVLAPAHHAHTAPLVKMGRKPKPGEFINPVGNFIDVGFARQALGIDWMSRDELAQAIPPAYSEWIGGDLLHHALRYLT